MDAYHCNANWPRCFAYAESEVSVVGFDVAAGLGVVGYGAQGIEEGSGEGGKGGGEG